MSPDTITYHCSRCEVGAESGPLPKPGELGPGGLPLLQVYGLPKGWTLKPVEDSDLDDELLCIECGEAELRGPSDYLLSLAKLYLESPDEDEVALEETLKRASRRERLDIDDVVELAMADRAMKCEGFAGEAEARSAKRRSERSRE